MEPPGDRFLEIETAKKHGGWPAWEKLPTVTRAELIAHELIKAMRDHYEFDMRMPASEKPAAPAPSPLTTMRERFLGGGHNKNA